mmetsp:Transcript_41764/g.126697  ORF Transcript_41764/g.126697 Transcript_41764/m.126697 type:complete len:89 (-) Transcript_41764:382-648(-)
MHRGFAEHHRRRFGLFVRIVGRNVGRTVTNVLDFDGNANNSVALFLQILTLSLTAINWWRIGELSSSSSSSSSSSHSYSPSRLRLRQR